MQTIKQSKKYNWKIEKHSSSINSLHTACYLQNPLTSSRYKIEEKKSFSI